MRRVLFAAGVVAGLWGGWLLIDHVDSSDLIRLPLWLAGAVFVDDFLLVPLAVAVGALLARWPDRQSAAVVRTTAILAGVTSLVALPLLARAGRGSNPTVLARDYLRDWLVLEAVVLLSGALAVILVRRRRSARPVPPDPDHPTAEPGSGRR